MRAWSAWMEPTPVPDLRRLLQTGLRRISRVTRHLPGTVGGMGIYFSAQEELPRRGRDYDWLRYRDELLSRADRALDAGRVDAALSWFDKALRLSYHPALHSAGGSPLVADPEHFLRPLRRSRTGAVLLSTEIPPSSRPPRPVARNRPEGSPVRLAVIAQENWTFIRPVLDALRATGRYEIREIEVEDLSGDEHPDREQVIRARHDLVTAGARIPTPARVADAYDWADVVLVEWGHHVLTWVSLLDRRPRLLVGRYHRFEVFTPFPLLHDHSVIDRLLHVSPPVRHLVDAVAPAAREVETRYVSNLLGRGLGELSEEPRNLRTLVQIGWNREIKDVLFSLEMLERLRRHDERFRLQLVGPGLPAASDENAYQRRVRARLASFDPQAVEMLGVRRDVPEILSSAGVVVSASNGEGTHESVMEGLATGCPAVIRDWPDALGYGGAASVYSADWVVSDVEEAVRRVLELQDPGRYEAETLAARRWAVEHRHPDRVIEGYEHALRPDAPGR